MKHKTSVRQSLHSVLLSLGLVACMHPGIAGAQLTITNDALLPEGTCRAYNGAAGLPLGIQGGTPPYNVYVAGGVLPQNLGPSTPDGTNWFLSGNIDVSMVNTTNVFTLGVQDSVLASTSKEFTLIVREGWDHPVWSPNDFESSGTGGIWNWSDPAAWAGGVPPGNDPGKVINLEQITSASTNLVDGTFTVGVLRSRNNNTVIATRGTGKLIFDNGAQEAIWNFNSRITRFTTLRADAFVDIQLNSDLDIRMGTARAEEVTVGRIGKTISGTGHLTLSLAQNDAGATRFEKLGAGGANTYSGGTTVRHVRAIAYGNAWNTQAAVQLNVLSTNAFGTGDVTLDGAGCTQNLTFAPALNRGMWVKFSTNDVIAPGRTLVLTNSSRIILDLAANTTNTAYVVADGVALDAGVRTGGDFSWLYGTGKLVILTTNPPPAITFDADSPLPPAREDSAYTQTLTAKGGDAPYTWSVSAGTLPLGLTLGADGVIGGTPQRPETAAFTVEVTDSKSVTGTKDYLLVVHSVVPPKLWDAPTITAADFNTTGSGNFTWSDTAAWAGGLVPLNAAGKQVSLEPRLVNDATDTVDGTYTIGGLSARNVNGTISALTGPGKLVFDNGANTAIWNHNRSSVRIPSLRPDIYVDLQLNSSLDLRVGSGRANEATVGRIGKQISGPGHLTLSLASMDANETRFFKLGEGATNTYSGGTTVRHVSQLPYATGDVSQASVQLNAVSQGAFGTGSVTLDGTSCTNSYFAQLAMGRGMWIRFSTNDVVAPNATLNLVGATNIVLELLPETTNTVSVNVDGVALPPGEYTGGMLEWPYGYGYLIVKPPAPTLSASYDGTTLKLEWPGNAILQAAPSLTGTFTNVPDATSPYMVNDLTEPQKFVRLLSQ